MSTSNVASASSDLSAIQISPIFQFTFSFVYNIVAALVIALQAYLQYRSHQACHAAQHQHLEKILSLTKSLSSPSVVEQPLQDAISQPASPYVSTDVTA